MSMQKSIEVHGKTEDEAIASALLQLNLQREDVSVEIVARAKSGFLGIGASAAIVKVTFEAADEPATPIAKPRAAEQGGPAPIADGEFEDRIRDFLSGLLSRMDIIANITIAFKADGSYVVELSGEGMGGVIGKRGETLDAIQHLTNYAVNRGSDNRKHIGIDAENYRSKREESLVRLAEKMAEKALKYKRSMALEPMNSYERHVIHTALQEYAGVTTGSTGSEPNRRVVVSCEKDKAD